MAVSDLTGTTWYFNDSVVFPGFSDIIEIDFNYTYDGYTDTGEVIYFSNNANIDYDIDDRVYTIGVGWLYSESRTIEILGGTDADNADVIAWFEANATQVTSGGELTVIYNNNTIHTSTADDTFTLQCNGKVMASDVTIQATDVDSLTVTYGGNTIATGSGTVTKTLSCNGKVMSSDVVINIVMSSYDYELTGSSLTIFSAPYTFEDGVITI